MEKYIYRNAGWNLDDYLSRWEMSLYTTYQKMVKKLESGPILRLQLSLLSIFWSEHTRTDTCIRMI